MVQSLLLVSVLLCVTCYGSQHILLLVCSINLTTTAFYLFLTADVQQSHGKTKHDGVLEVLSFPEQDPVQTESDGKTCISCLLCSLTFDINRGNEEILKHIQLEHKLIIADVNLISNFTG